MERDKVTELTKQLVAELDARITEVEQQLRELKQKRAALTNESNRRGASALGLRVIAANNTLRRLRREGASKTEITKAQKDLDDLRQQLKTQKSKGGRQ